MNIAVCSLCPHECRIAPNGRGACHARTNIEGNVVPLTYGALCAIQTDPVEKKPFFHVLPGSSAFSIAAAGCNLHCRYCQNWQISQKSPDKRQAIHLSPQAVIKEALRQGCRSIAYTYTEPVVAFEYTRATCALARDRGLLNLLVTAGYVNAAPLRELCRVADAANVDLKGMTEDFYRRMSGATLKPVLDAIIIMKKAGLWLEITNLIVPGWNDSDHDLRTLARWVHDNCGKDTPVHFSRFHPMHRLTDIPPTPVSTIIRARAIALAEGLHFVYTGNIPGDDGEHTFCPVDGEKIISRCGFEITENRMDPGACGTCGTKLPGIWK